MPGDELPFISIVVPALNAERTIGRCLEALVHVDYPRERHEIVLVDNASSDRTADIAKRYPVRYLVEERRGPSFARNRGIEASRGDIVASTDSDCLATTGWLRELVNAFADERVGGVAGEILAYPPQTPAERYAARIRHLSPQRYLRRPVFPFAVTANLAFRREVFDRIGLLDVSSPRGGESTDLCTRFFRGTGLRLAYAPKAIVFHEHRSTTWEFVRQQWGYGRGHAYLYAKYRDDLQWTWRQAARVYGDLAVTTWSLGAVALRHAARRDRAEDLHFLSFEVLRKLALRGGFLHEAVSRHRLSL